MFHSKSAVHNLLSPIVSLAMNINQIRLLLIVSDRTTASISEFRLRLLGYGVTLVGRGEDFAAATSESEPDLVIVELALPGLSGFETITHIRRKSAMPIIALSPDSSPESVRQAFVAGASEYLLMPFDPATLEEKIERLTSANSSLQLASGRGV